MRIFKRQVLLCFVLITAFRSIAFAHFPDQSYIYLQLKANSINGRFEVSTKDLNKVFGLQLHPGFVRADVDPHLARIQAYVLQHASFSTIEGPGYQIQFTEPDILRAESFGDFLELKFELLG